MVRDVSHPDYVSQTNTVRATLRSLPLPADTPLIVVNNKADLLRDDDHVEDSILQEGPLVSSTEGDGTSLISIRRSMKISLYISSSLAFLSENSSPLGFSV